MERHRDSGPDPRLRARGPEPVAGTTPGGEAPTVAAVIVAYNSGEELRRLFAAGLPGFDPVIVVDNGSTDDSAEVARAAGAVVIREENRGFGAGVNAGAKLVKNDFFVVINPDVRLPPPADAQRLTAALRESRVGASGPRMVLPNGNTQDSARGVPTPVDLLRRRRGETMHGGMFSSSPIVVPWVVGGCMALNRAAFEEVGGFDDRFFLYFEDVDLCVRLGRRGWRVVYDPRVCVLHEHQAASRGKLISGALKAHAKSAARFFAKHPRFIRRRHVYPVPLGSQREGG